ncbi:SDR family oxidoreductase [bacterium]|nr:SDR family oxidoreductase [bacterium]
MHPAFEDLKNKNAVITGGAGMIGRSLALALGRCGVRVAILDLNREAAEKTAAEVTGETRGMLTAAAADVLEKESLERALGAIHESIGELDILINCAGGNAPGATTAAERFEEIHRRSPDDTFFGLDMAGFRRVFDLNVLGTVLPTLVFAKDMIKRGGGTVVNISSMNAYRPLTRIPAYSAAKASINNFTQWLAVHLAKMNIRVNAIAPGFFLTDQNRYLLQDKKTGEWTERGKKILQATPMGAFGKVEDLQGALLFLVSDLSRFVTGTVLPVDGGFNAYSGV